MLRSFFQSLLGRYKEQDLPPEADEDVDRLSLVIVRDGKMLFVREPGKELLFDPGGRRIAGQDDETTLANKIRRDLGITLTRPLEPLLSYKAPATPDKPEETMVVQRCYMLNPYQPPINFNKLRTRKQLVWADSHTQEKFSPASEGLRQLMRFEEYID